MSRIAEDVWKNCLKIIKDNVNLQSYKTWFEPIKPIKPLPSVYVVDQTHDDQPIHNFNKYSDFLEYPKHVNTYYAIPTTSMMKFDGTEPFELIKAVTLSIKGKMIFCRLLVRYTG